MSDWLALLAFGLAGGLVGFFVGRRSAALRSGSATDGEQADFARQLDDLQSLQELSFTLAESLDVERIVSQVVGHLSRSIATDGILLAVAEGGAMPLRVLAAHGTLASLSGREISEPEAGLIGEAMGAEHLQVADADEGIVPQLTGGISAQTAAVAPLRAHGITVGALAAVRDTVAPFSSADLRQLSTVASHAAIVLENARLFTLVTAGKHQWEVTFDALTEGIAVLDNENRIRRANRALAELAGKPMPAVVNAEMIPLVAGDTSALREYLARIRAAEPAAALTVRSRPLARTLRITAAPIPQASEGWLVALIEDVTEREAMEAQLIQSEKMAAVGQLVSGVAHELNNPLSSIAGVSDLLLGSGSESDSVRSQLTLINEQAERAGRIVRNLLTFARTGPDEVTDVDLNEIGESTVALVAHDLRLRHIDLVQNLAQPTPTTRGNKHELQQVVLNLLTNAIQAVSGNPEDRPRRIRLTTSRRENDAVLSVADSGPGVPNDMVSQIFLPFFTTKAPGEGTGLGLSIAIRIVEGHGGRMTVQRSSDGGSNIEVLLPRSQTLTGATSRAPLAPSVDLDPLPGLQNTGSILLVENDSAVRRSLLMLLSHDGHSVTAAANGAEASNLLRGNTYDVVVLEPHHSGEQPNLAQALLDEWPELSDRLLLITGDVRPETEEWLHACGCRYLRKPVHASALRAAVSAVLNQPGHRGV